MTSQVGVSLVLLTGWEPPVQKIPAVKVLREHARLSLADATRAIDRCLVGATVTIAVPSTGIAERLARAITELGVRAEVQQSAPVPGSD